MSMGLFTRSLLVNVSLEYRSNNNSVARVLR